MTDRPQEILYTAEAVIEGRRDGHGKTPGEHPDAELSVPRETGTEGDPGTGPTVWDPEVERLGEADCWRLISPGGPGSHTLAGSAWPCFRSATSWTKAASCSASRSAARPMSTFAPGYGAPSTGWPSRSTTSAKTPERAGSSSSRVTPAIWTLTTVAHRSRCRAARHRLAAPGSIS
jgi:hypothetical protein